MYIYIYKYLYIYIYKYCMYTCIYRFIHVYRMPHKLRVLPMAYVPPGDCNVSWFPPHSLWHKSKIIPSSELLVQITLQWRLFTLDYFSVSVFISNQCDLCDL